MNAVNAGDLDGLLGLMTGDAIFLAPGSEPMGRDAFALGFSSAHRQSLLRCASELQEVVVAGDIACTVCRDALGVTPREGGLEAQLTGHRLSVCLRQPDGRWLLARDAHTLTAAASPAQPTEGR